jgi:hypothetical protein
MAVDAQRAPARFDPEAFASFRFVSRALDASGGVELGYALDDQIAFSERFRLPVAATLSTADRARVDGLLALLHWVAGVSYFKTAAPLQVRCETGAPPPATARLLESLYSEGLGEFAYANRLAGVPRPRFPRRDSGEIAAAPRAPSREPGRVLVPVGGGKDSAVALEIVRRSGLDEALFSVGDAAPIARTVATAGLPWLRAERQLDPALARLNASGARNGHVPVTAIVACAALLTAALNGFDTVALANERSASRGSVRWDGIEINHQFSKGFAAELLLRDALAEASPELQLFSVLRRASELTIARAFARLERYHTAFTSCNAIFRLDPQLRASSWCCECPKCRFVYLILAPFSDPSQLRAIFGRDLLEEEQQYEGFALLTATGGPKPFECVGEEEESLAAIRLLAGDRRWREHRVLARLAGELLSAHAEHEGDPAAVLALGEEHAVPATLLPHVDALLGA